jgi:imidazolonepropionase-like amidohydrolase
LILIMAAWAVPATRSVYAIKDAKIYPVSGPMITRGTVVIRNGLIDAVGANVSIPPEATIIDGMGLTVYPGLIDSFSDAGLLPALAEPAAPAVNAAAANVAPRHNSPSNGLRRTRMRRFFKPLLA